MGEKNVAYSRARTFLSLDMSEDSLEASSVDDGGVLSSEEVLVLAARWAADWYREDSELSDGVVVKAWVLRLHAWRISAAIETMEIFMVRVGVRCDPGQLYWYGVWSMYGI